MRLQFILSEIWIGLRRNMSMAVSVVLVTMVSLFFLGFGLLARSQVDTMKDYWYDRVQVSIFLCTNNSDTSSCAAGPVTDEQRQQIKSQLDEMRPLVKEVFHESPQEAYQRFKVQFKNSPIVDNVKPDQMPESYRVRLSDPSKYAVISSSFQGAPGVEQVQDQRALLDKFFTALNIMSLCAVGLSGAMVLCAILLMVTTIRQTAFSRRRETGIMRLVGASAFVIQLPFIMETVIATLVGCALAVGLLWATVHYGVTGFLATILPIGFVGVGDVWAMTPWLVRRGAALAMVTSWCTRRRDLRV
ncbi:MAG: permease-like cell division protein FtsX [Oryzihumus sp.]